MQIEIIKRIKYEINEIEELVINNNIILERTSDLNDIASEETALNFNLLNLERKREKLKSLKDSLKRIENNPEFHYCEICGEDIGLKRLLMIPTTTVCINCQENIENNIKKY